VPKETQFLLGIETSRSAAATLPRHLKTLGRVVTPTSRQAEIHTPFQGIVLNTAESSLPSRGAIVQKGDILAVVEQVMAVPENLNIVTEIARTESELKQRREEAELAELELTRVTNLGESISGRRIAEAKSAVTIARQRVDGLTKALQEMRHALSTQADNSRQVAIEAPLDGVIVAAHVTQGEFVEPQKLLFEILDPATVWLEADVYEMDLQLVEDASRAEIVSEAYPADRFTGTVAFIDRRLDKDARTIKTVFEVENTGGKLREGMFANVLIETKATESGTLIPKAGVVNIGGENVVYVKSSPETFVARRVEVLGTWGDNVMLSSGVEAGEIVVVQGMYQVRTSGL